LLLRAGTITDYKSAINTCEEDKHIIAFLASFVKSRDAHLKEEDTGA
jgi:hypothetical protein